MRSFSAMYKQQILFGCLERASLYSLQYPTLSPATVISSPGWFPSSLGWSVDPNVLMGLVACSTHIFTFTNLTYVWSHPESHGHSAGLLSHALELHKETVGLMAPIRGIPQLPPERANSVFRCKGALCTYQEVLEVILPMHCPFLQLSLTKYSSLKICSPSPKKYIGMLQKQTKKP